MNTDFKRMLHRYLSKISKFDIISKHKNLNWKAPEGLFPDRENVRSVFNTIFEKNIWGIGSGGGSNFRNAKPYCDYLQKFFEDYQIKSVIDYGCGDWRISEHIEWQNIHYLGIDVVNSLVEQNTKLHGRENIRFMCANILDSDVFLPDADLFILKDVLQHLSNANVLKILMVALQYPYVLITNDYSKKNLDCKNGDTRPLDIRRKPFYLKQARQVLAYKYKKSFLIQSSSKLQQV